MDFDDFFDDDIIGISQAAMLLDDARTGLENGEITKEQFDELVEDVLQVEQMIKLSDDLERRIAIQEKIEMLKQIVSTVGGLI